MNSGKEKHGENEISFNCEHISNESAAFHSANSQRKRNDFVYVWRREKCILNFTFSYGRTRALLLAFFIRFLIEFSWQPKSSHTNRLIIVVAALLFIQCVKQHNLRDVRRRIVLAIL